MLVRVTATYTDKVLGKVLPFGLKIDMPDPERVAMLVERKLVTVVPVAAAPAAVVEGTGTGTPDPDPDADGKGAPDKEET